MGHTGVRWGGSCRGRVGWGGVGLGHAGVEWVTQRWGGSCRGGVGWVVSCIGGCVMEGWGGL